jgi:hypothetical protein
MEKQICPIETMPAASTASFFELTRLANLTALDLGYPVLEQHRACERGGVSLVGFVLVRLSEFSLETNCRVCLVRLQGMVLPMPALEGPVSKRRGRTVQPCSEQSSIWILRRLWTMLRSATTSTASENRQKRYYNNQVDFNG